MKENNRIELNRERLTHRNIQAQKQYFQLVTH